MITSMEENQTCRMVYSRKVEDLFFSTCSLLYMFTNIRKDSLGTESLSQAATTQTPALRGIHKHEPFYRMFDDALKKTFIAARSPVLAEKYIPRSFCTRMPEGFESSLQHNKSKDEEATTATPIPLIEYTLGNEERNKLFLKYQHMLNFNSLKGIFVNFYFL